MYPKGTFKIHSHQEKAKAFLPIFQPEFASIWPSTVINNVFYPSEGIFALLSLNVNEPSAIELEMVHIAQE